MSAVPAAVRIIPPLYFLAALAAMVFFDRVVPGMRFIRMPATLAGVMPLVIGLGLVVTTVTSLRRHHTAVRPSKEPSTLVTTGTFGVSRNPVYLGMVMMLLGAAILLGSITPFCVVAVFAWWIHTRFVAYEESVLLARFGDEYRQYQSTVRRWV